MKNITTIAKTYMQHITAARRAEAKDDTRTANREYDAARTYRKMLSDYDETQIFNMVNKPSKTPTTPAAHRRAYGKFRKRV